MAFDSKVNDRNDVTKENVKVGREEKDIPTTVLFTCAWCATIARAFLLSREQSIS